MEYATELADPADAEAHAAIGALLERYERALNTGDAELAVSCYAPDALMMAAGQPTVAGPELLAAYSAGFAVFRMAVSFSVDEIVVTGSGSAQALTRSTGHRVMLADGSQTPESNREVFLLRVDAGAWKIARYLFNQPG